jgi:hypothetical protein
VGEGVVVVEGLGEGKGVVEGMVVEGLGEGEGVVGKGLGEGEVWAKAWWAKAFLGDGLSEGEGTIRRSNKRYCN